MTIDPSTAHPETVGPSDVERVEDLPLTPAELWESVGTAEGLAGWLGDEVDVDLRPGGEGRVREDGEERVLLVDEVVPGRRVSFTWWPWHDRSARSYVELEVLPHGAGSRLVVRETRMSGATGRAVLVAPPGRAGRRARLVTA